MRSLLFSPPLISLLFAINRETSLSLTCADNTSNRIKMHPIPCTTIPDDIFNTVNSRKSLARRYSSLRQQCKPIKLLRSLYKPHMHVFTTCTWVTTWYALLCGPIPGVYQRDLKLIMSARAWEKKRDDTVRCPDMRLELQLFSWFDACLFFLINIYLSITLLYIHFHTLC